MAKYYATYDSIAQYRKWVDVRNTILKSAMMLNLITYNIFIWDNKLLGLWAAVRECSIKTK